MVTLVVLDVLFIAVVRVVQASTVVPNEIRQPGEVGNLESPISNSASATAQ